MMSELKTNCCSGNLCFLNGIKVDYRAEVYFNEYHQSVITVYGIERGGLLTTESGQYTYAVIRLENKEYLTVFDLYVEITTYTKIVEEKSEFDDEKVVFISSTTLKGKNYFEEEDSCKELIMEITDGCELIGVCPYDLNKNYTDIIKCKKIEIPIQPSWLHVDTVIGELRMQVCPKYISGKDSFTLGFSHSIRFKPIQALSVREIRKTMAKLTSLFSLLCGETVTINKLSVVKPSGREDEFIDFIGICNFTKEKLIALDNSGIDTTRFKRISVFKLSDFDDLEKAMDYWFEHYDMLLNAQNAYNRILLDEELEIVTVNKFLAAMQLIEGYTQAYADEEKELSEFSERKNNILSKLTEKEDIEFVDKGLGFSGITFRKSLREYLYKGVSRLEKISKRLFSDKNNALIERIVNDRNFYTHSSGRTMAQMTFSELLDVATVCKNVYRILLLSDMGIPHSLLLKRYLHSLCAEVFKNVLGIQLSLEGEPTGYDKAMWHFSDY